MCFRIVFYSVTDREYKYNEFIHALIEAFKARMMS